MIVSRLARLAIPLLLIATPARAQSIKSYNEWFTSVSRKLMATTKAPAMSIAVMDHGKVIFADAGGTIATPPRRGPNPGTMYRIGSVSKLFTAAVAARLASRGVVNLDADVRQYVPEYSEKNAPITLRQLAGHLGGIRHYGLGEFINTTRYDSLAPTINIFRNSPLVSAPGTKYIYSSYGFNLLALALERAAHKPFLRLLQDEVFSPIGLKHTAPDRTDRTIADRAAPYAFDSTGAAVPATRDDLSDRFPSGGLLASVMDLVRFGDAFTKPGFLSDSMRKVMTTPQHLASGAATIVGLGWRVGADSAGRVIWHHGGTSNGGRALLVVWPEEQLVVAIAANAMVSYDLPAAFALANVAREGRKYR